VAARERGYAGPAGVDAFVFADPEAPGAGAPILRPVVELNARFTAGTVTIGLVRRLLPRLKRKELRLRASERMRFRFWLSLPASERATLEARSGDGDALLVLLDEGPTPPALFFTRGELPG